MLCWADVAVALLLMGGPYQSLALALAAMTSCGLLVLVSLGGGLVLAGALAGGREGYASSENCARDIARHCFRNRTWHTSPV